MKTRFMSGCVYASGSGTNYARITLPAGGILRLAQARNFTKPGQRVIIELTDTTFLPTALNDTYGDVLPIAAKDQGGVQDPCTWSGDTGPLDQSLQQVVAVFFNCDAADRLLLMVGVETDV